MPVPFFCSWQVGVVKDTPVVALLIRGKIERLQEQERATQAALAALYEKGNDPVGPLDPKSFVEEYARLTVELANLIEQISLLGYFRQKHCATVENLVLTLDQLAYLDS
jgi:hypothetical protein